MKKNQRQKRELLPNNTLLIELKCFLQKPMESNVNILVDEMRELVQGPKEVEYVTTAPDLEKAISLEDLFG